MKVAHQSLAVSGTFLPQPKIEVSADGQTIALLCNWGQAAASEIVLEKIKTASMAKEFPPDIEFLHALQAANHEIYKTENQNTWKTVIEVTVLHVRKGTLYWVHAGGPDVLLHRVGQASEVLSVTPRLQQPLPVFGLGLDETPLLNSGFALLDQDRNPIQIILINSTTQARRHLEDHLSHLQEKVNHEQLSEILALVAQDQSAWIAALD